MRCGEFYELRLRKAMSVQEAKDALGFKPSDEPTKEEIAKAYKNLAFKHHPDKGGDPSKMVEINVAKDVLEGKQRATGPIGPSTYQPQTYTTQRPDPPKPIHISFQEAMQKAGVPTSGVDWKFKTDSGYGRISNGSESGYVVYGCTDREHIFVGVYYFMDRGNMFQPLDIEKYTMFVQKAPINSPLADVGPKIIRAIWSKFGRNVKQYNAKVQLLKDGFKFTESDRFSGSGRSIPFKTAVQQLGEDVPEKWKGKVDITLEMGPEIEYPSTHKLKHCYKCCRPVLVVNGKEYKLSDKAAEVVHINDLYSKMWGKKYWYCDSTSRKKLNRVANAKKILTFFADLCSKYGEPKELVEALRAAAEQVK